jgi:aminoglycoside N3'-acetyltransferase
VGAADPRQIVDALALRSGDVIFIKASMDRLGFDGPLTVRLLDAIVERIGATGTVVMPSFPYPNEVGRPADDFVFDVRRTPSHMGLLSEVLRRYDGAVRSENFWVPAVAWGAHAEWLTGDQLTVRNPFGPGSVYRRLTELPTRMVGIGVSLNYNILAHVADAELHEQYPFAIFEREPLAGYVVGHDGKRHRQLVTIVSQTRRLKMRPSRLVDASAELAAAKVFHDFSGAWVWSVPGLLYFQESLRLGRAALDNGRLPPWLEEMI